MKNNNLQSSQNFVIVKERTRASKLGRCAATYVPYQTCPDGCPLKPKVRPDGTFSQGYCYASCGNVARHMERITKAAIGHSLTTIASLEAERIKRLPGDVPLRLHVGGETANIVHAELLAEAADVYTSKHGQPVFTKTHNWRTIPRSAWGSISVLASCEFSEEGYQEPAQANNLGYAASLLIPQFPTSPEVFRYGAATVLPCKAKIADQQGSTVNCDTCRLCMKDGVLRDRGVTIGLPIHGSKARELIQIVQ